MVLNLYVKIKNSEITQLELHWVIVNQAIDPFTAEHS